MKIFFSSNNNLMKNYMHILYITKRRKKEVSVVQVTSRNTGYHNMVNSINIMT